MGQEYVTFTSPPCTVSGQRYPAAEEGLKILFSIILSIAFFPAS